MPRDAVPRWRLHERHLAVTTTRTITIANQHGGTHVVDAARPLLDTLEEHGIDLPYGCRYGGCITCAAKLTSGEVDQHEQVALNNRQLTNGYIVLCVAKPLSDCTLEVGVDSHDKLYRNPFFDPLEPHELKPAIATPKPVTAEPATAEPATRKEA
ncbi:MAG: 2Fe-2S iron-sulfur cluster binding domain-containing protein [Ilumatobacter sp.]|nr:2Fe-2S iron-sulfur cluster binding domain-containing protein [Ilumatobacter sp.]